MEIWYHSWHRTARRRRRGEIAKELDAGRMSEKRPTLPKPPSLIASRTQTLSSVSFEDAPATPPTRGEPNNRRGRGLAGILSVHILLKLLKSGHDTEAHTIRWFGTLHGDHL